MFGSMAIKKVTTGVILNNSAAKVLNIATVSTV